MSTPMTGYQSLTPAYGRDYQNKQSAIDDFKAGKDFVVHLPTGRSTYCSIRDFAVGATANIRYKKLQMVCSYTVKPADVASIDKQTCAECGTVDPARAPRYHALGHPAPGTVGHLLYLKPDINPLG